MNIIIGVALLIFFSGVFVGRQETSKTPEPTSAPISQPTKSPTPKESVETDIQVYFYPGSKTTASSKTSLSLESNDNPDSITNWYKDKIKSEAMNVTSFVVTKTNDNVLNKLVGAKTGVEVSVEIKKNAGDSNVHINISLRT